MVIGTSTTPETADLTSGEPSRIKWAGAKTTVYQNTESGSGIGGAQPWVKVEFDDGSVEWYPLTAAIIEASKQ